MDKLKELINSDYIKNINNNNVDTISSEIRNFLIDNIMKTGGHLASNLGVVELILTIHKVFDFPKDKIIFDVGHQCYVHKILTGRYDKFHTLRQFGGISGFPKTQESDCDSFNTGHSGTSISAALGIARARDLNKEKYDVIAFVGDGAISSGMPFEALNDAGVSNSKIIIILNDNEMSINKNVGGLSSHLSMLRLNPGYLNVKSRTHSFLNRLGIPGKFLTKLIKKVKSIIKTATIKNPLFENLGITYIGLIDGYDIDELTAALQKAKNSPKTVIIHTATKKGKGYYEAETNPSEYHGVSAYSPDKIKSSKTYTNIFSEFMVNKAKVCSNLTAITAAMCTGCGLNAFKEKYPDRFYDVGIAEEHAVTMGAGMAIGGLTPVFGVYSTFLQRAYDQILHDVCMQNLHVIFAVDRAGIVGEDGETHQGVFDLSYLLHIPNMTVMAPCCEEEFVAMLNYAIDKSYGPVAIRYPKDVAISIQNYSFDFKKPQSLYYTGDEILMLSIGRMSDVCRASADILIKNNYDKIHIVNIGTIKPLNVEYLDDLISKSEICITVEDNIVSGGAGEFILSNISKKNKSKVLCIGFDDTFIQHGKQSELFKEYGISPEIIVEKIKKEMINI